MMFNILLCVCFVFQMLVMYMVVVFFDWKTRSYEKGNFQLTNLTEQLKCFIDKKRGSP